jgi:hypothetical protein
MHALLPKLLQVKINDLFLRCLVDDAFKLSLGLALGAACPDLHVLFACGVGTAEETIHRLSVQVGRSRREPPDAAVAQLFTAKRVGAEYGRVKGSSLLGSTVAALQLAYEVAAKQSNRIGELEMLAEGAVRGGGGGGARAKG